MPGTEFIPGLTLGGLFYGEAVQPILDAEFPGLPHSAALIGSGSEIFGFDTEMSTDHDWGPRVMLFLAEGDADRHGAAIRETLRQKLPRRFRGYPIGFSEPDPNDNGTQVLQETTEGPVEHRVEVQTLQGYILGYLGLDLTRGLEPADWLTIPEQKLRAITTGAVYHDEVGLQALRDQFAYYPRDVWLYLLASGWSRIGDDEHLMGRAGFVGDEIGSALIGARLARDVMRLCLLMEKQYAPYPKWFGTAFRQLRCAPGFEPILRAALRAETWQEREAQLAAAYERLAEMHNALGITEPRPATVSSFFGRPFRVIWGGGFTNAIGRQITDPAVQRIAARRLIGGIDQWSDSTDLLEDVGRRDQARAFYGG